MKKLLVLFALMLIIFTGCSKVKVTNFEECVRAGNPVMESYPRQCRHGDQTFVEVVAEPVQPPKKLIGGETDDHGCLGPAGYTWDEDVGACIRDWELTEVQKDAAKRNRTEHRSRCEPRRRCCSGCVILGSFCTIPHRLISQFF